MKITCELTKKEATGFLSTFLKKIFDSVEEVTVDEVKVKMKNDK